MTQQLQIESVRRTITVPIAPERAFTLFTERMHAWWPPTHSITEAPFETAVIEPRAGGRWYERAQDGAEADWGRVLAYEPPHRVLLSWHLRSDYSYDPDPAHASEIEVRFVPDGDGTRVELEHGQFEKHGEGGVEIHDSVGSENGWSGILALYAQAA
jgi:uncharacterized protein YndB with AHSA1/START domain